MTVNPNLVNTLMTISKMGEGLGAGQTLSQAMGAAAQQNIRNKMFQRATAEQAKKESALRDQVISALQGGNLLSPQGDMRGADSVTFNGDGTYKIAGGAQGKGEAGQGTIAGGKDVQPWSYTPGVQTPVLTDQPLEGMKTIPSEAQPQQATELGTQSVGQLDPQILRALLTSPEITEQSLAGLAPEDIMNLLGAQAGVGRERTGIIQDLLSRKERAVGVGREEQRYRDELTRAAETAKTKRAQQLEDITTKQKGRIELEREKARLRGNEKGLTEYQQAQLAQNQQRIDATKAKEIAAQERDVIAYETQIMEDPGSAAVAPMMDYINNEQNKPYYYIQYDKDAGDLIDFSPDIVGERVPLVDKKGRQLTMYIVRKAAEKLGITPEEFLANPNIGILKEMDGAYFPADFD